MKIFFATIITLIYTVLSEEFTSTVFQAESEGYHCVRIPSLLKLQSGVLLAFGEGRKLDCEDHTWVDIVMKKSFDFGKTWTPLEVLFTNSTDQEQNFVGNVAPVQLRENQRVILPFTRNAKDCLWSYSDDNGETWSEPQEMKGVKKLDWKMNVFGPPGSIQLKSGRIIIPGYHKGLLSFIDAVPLTKGHIVYSDDLGETWHLGATDIGAGTNHFINESQAVQLTNGTVLVNSRGLSYLPSSRRIQSYSNDEGMTFEPSYYTRNLTENFSGCEGSTIADDRTGYLYYSGNLGSNDILRLWRWNMTIFRSTDEGNNWELYKIVDPAAASYSSLQILQESNQIAIIYEQMDAKSFQIDPERIVITVYDLEDNNSQEGEKQQEQDFAEIDDEEDLEL